MADDTEKGDPKVGAYYGLPFFHYDLVAKFVPGAIALWLTWFVDFDEKSAVAAWSWATSSWLAEFALLLAAYVLGGMLDSFTWYPIEQMAKIQWKLMRPYKKETKLPNNWGDAFGGLSRNREKVNMAPECMMQEKAHVESRGLFSTGLVLLLCLAFWWFTRPQGYVSLADRASTGSPMMIIVPLSVSALLAIVGSYFRQRRRVIGATYVLKEYLSVKS